MDKKTLKQKIKYVQISAVVFSIIYFLLGAFLKSDGPIFDSAKTYELIRDSLTITAYFLAPAAAIVLFSDWREQHVEKLLEEESTIIYNQFLAFIDMWQNYKFTITDDESFVKTTVESREESHFSLLDQVEKSIQLAQQLHARSTKAKEFSEEAIKCLKEARTLIFELNILGGFKEKQLNPSVYNFDYTDETDEEFSSRMGLNFDGMEEQMTKAFMQIYKYKTTLLELSKKLKIKN
ncbi:hypothetical protein [Acinetobacter junii]|uniref:hypothetical protein n=1 Tax=Acinetobacter junii TaxID=40215 RepID=UPI0019021E37|nr:hypothetical protein [Acinetobacter junii]MBJ8440034.1 hypothetical protein [Acinetobacter junii]